MAKDTRDLLVEELSRPPERAHAGSRLQHEDEYEKRHAHGDHSDGEAPVVCLYV